MRRDRLDGVGDRDDPGAQEDVVTDQTLGVAGAVESLVVLCDHLRNRPRQRDPLQDGGAALGMTLHEPAFGLGEWPGAGEDLCRYRDLADVVNRRRHLDAVDFIGVQAEAVGDRGRQSRHPTLVTRGVGVTELHDRREGCDGLAQEVLETLHGLDPVGDVLAVNDEPTNRGVLNLVGGRELHDPLGTPLRAGPERPPHRRVGSADRAVKQREDLRSVLGCDQLGDATTNDRVRLVAVEPLVCRVRVAQHAIYVHDGDEFRGVLHQRCKGVQAQVPSGRVWWFSLPPVRHSGRENLRGFAHETSIGMQPGCT